MAPHFHCPRPQHVALRGRPSELVRPELARHNKEAVALESLRCNSRNKASGWQSKRVRISPYPPPAKQSGTRQEEARKRIDANECLQGRLARLTQTRERARRRSCWQPFDAQPSKRRLGSEWPRGGGRKQAHNLLEESLDPECNPKNRSPLAERLRD